MPPIVCYRFVDTSFSWDSLNSLKRLKTDRIAIAWVAAKGALPIIGPRTLAQLENNLAAANVTLSANYIASLDQVSAIPRIFPYTVLDDPWTRDLCAGGRADKVDLPSEPVA